MANPEIAGFPVSRKSVGNKILVGYNLGDFNVLTAVDWSRNVFKNANPSDPNDIIQFLYCESDPKPEPYPVNGVIILEFDNLSNLLKELCEVIKDNRKAFDLQIRKLKSAENKIRDPTENMV